MPPNEPAAVGNRLLAALPRKDPQRFLAGCEQVELVFAEVLAEPGQRIRHVLLDGAQFGREIEQSPKLLDRGSLEAASCGCYAADVASYDRIMG